MPLLHLVVRRHSTTDDGLLLRRQVHDRKLTVLSAADPCGLPDGTIFGIIASTTEPFCSTCDRSRLTADGMWFLCLYAAHGIDLREPLRQGASKDEIRSLIVRGWTDRTDRGAEDRQALDSRGPLYQIEDLRENPHREMHTLGG